MLCAAPSLHSLRLDPILRKLSCGQRMSASLKTIAVLTLLLVPAAQPGVAQVSDTTLASVRDGIFTTAQAERGATIFEEVCLRCHQPEQFTGPGFIGAWSGQTVDALFELIRTTMPEDNPSSLKKREYAAVLAYLFSLNGIPAGETALPSVTRKLKQIRIESVSEIQKTP